MSIEANMQYVIENRRTNFYGRFDELMSDEGRYYFTSSEDPSFDFETGSDEEKEYYSRLARLQAVRVGIESLSKTYYMEDETSKFLGYSYEEILGMANNGATIPDEVLEWAYSMVDVNTSETTTNTEGADATTLYNSMKGNPNLNVKNIATVFVDECTKRTDELDLLLEELLPIEKEMEAARINIEGDKKDSLNKIENIIKEWANLQRKINNGEELTKTEKSKYKELQGLLAKEDKNYQTKIDTSTNNFTNISNKLLTVNEKANQAMNFGAQTMFIAEELAMFEKTSSNSGLFRGLTTEGYVGFLASNNLVSNANYSQIAHSIGVDTEYLGANVTDVVAQVNTLMENSANIGEFSLDDTNHKAKSLTEITLPNLTNEQKEENTKEVKQNKTTQEIPQEKQEEITEVQNKTTETQKTENVTEEEIQFESTEYKAEGVNIPEYNQIKFDLKSMKYVNEENSNPEISQDDDAQNEKQDFDTEAKKLENEAKNAQTTQNKAKKEQQTLEKGIKKDDQEIKNTDAKIKEVEKAVNEAEKEGMTAQSNAPTDEAEVVTDTVNTQMGELDSISAEVADANTEANNIIEETKKQIQTVIDANQQIVDEMDKINSELEQDNVKMQDYENQLKAELQKPVEPVTQKTEIQPTQEIQNTQPVEDNFIEEEIIEEEQSSTNEQINYSSDEENDFVGFVAQSDSLSAQNKNNPKTNNSDKKITTKKKNSKPQFTDNQNKTPIEATATSASANTNDSDTKQENPKIQNIRVNMQSVRSAAFNKQTKLMAMSIRANNNVMANIKKESYAQAQAARQERLALEKQEQVQEIKQYANTASKIAGTTTNAGVRIEKTGTKMTENGGKLLTEGFKKVTKGTEGTAKSTEQIATGTTQTVTGETEVTIGTTQVTTGVAQTATGVATTAAGTATETAGQITLATGTALAAGVITAPASPPPIAAGTATIIAGGATIGAGTAMEITGTALEATGVTEQATGTANIAQGASNISLGGINLAKFTADTLDGNVKMALGSEKMATGATLTTTGGIVKAVGSSLNSAATATSAYADAVSGNVIGAIGSIAGTISSLTGVTIPLSETAQNAMQFASQGATVAGQLISSNAGQNNNDNNKQNQNKKKTNKSSTKNLKFQQPNKQVQKIKNRFNK